MAIDIFISYSRKDKLFVDQLARQLGEEFKVWWDDNILVGEQLEKTIFDKVERVPITIIVLSENSLASDWVKRETAIALDKSNVIPVIIDNSPIPEPLSNILALRLDIHSDLSVQQNFTQLQRDIKIYLQENTKSSSEPERLKSITIFESIQSKKKAIIVSIILFVLAILAVMTYEESAYEKEILLEKKFNESVLTSQEQHEAVESILASLRDDSGIIKQELKNNRIQEIAVIRPPFRIHYEEVPIRGDSKKTYTFYGWDDDQDETIEIHPCPTTLPKLSLRENWYPTKEIACAPDLYAAVQNHQEAVVGLSKLIQDDKIRLERLALIELSLLSVVSASEHCAGMGEIYYICLLNHPEGYCPSMYTAKLLYMDWRENWLKDGEHIFDTVKKVCFNFNQSIFPKHYRGSDSNVDGFVRYYYQIESDNFKPKWIRLLESGKFKEARALLKDGVKANNLRSFVPLAIFYDQGIGGDKDLLRARRLLELASESKNKKVSQLANFNLGISKIFGRGGFPDVSEGSALLRKAINKGANLETLASLRKSISGNIIPTTFSESFREINLLSRQGNPVALTIKGIYTAQGIAIPPCEKVECERIARETVAKLHDMGEKELAEILNRSVSSASKSTSAQIMHSSRVSRLNVTHLKKLKIDRSRQLLKRSRPRAPTIGRAVIKVFRLASKYR